MAEAQDVKEGGLTGRLGVAAAVSATAAVLYGYDTGITSGALLQIEDDFGVGDTWKQLIAASILLAAYRSTLYGLHERGARATLEVRAVPLHTTNNHSR